MINKTSLVTHIQKLFMIVGDVDLLHLYSSSKLT